eukprot:g13379.t1 g13379   contig8:554464-557723(-)
MKLQLSSRKMKSAVVVTAAALFASLCLTFLSESQELLEEHQPYTPVLLNRIPINNGRGLIDSHAPIIDVDSEMFQADAFETDHIVSYESLISSSTPLPKYTLQDALSPAHIYRDTYGFVVYDPSADEFIGMYPRSIKWSYYGRKLINSMGQLTFMLRQIFPERFQGESSDELVIPVSSGDFPYLMGSECIQGNTELPCVDLVAPILHFGSTFKRNLFPNMIGMPMPGFHLTCFADWAAGGSACNFGEEHDLEYDDLIPQLVWRGTDFGYLANVHPEFRRPLNDAADADVLRSKYDNLVPRWKGVILTSDSEAEHEANQTPGTVPLIKYQVLKLLFEGKSTPTQGHNEFLKWEEVGIKASGEHMNSSELAQYKYHIDLGGGGGTTWAGTVQKLAMAGVLLHHETPTKDYIHDYMKPYVHYVPIKEDLTDVNAKLEWCESHPYESKQMSKQASELMRYLSSDEGFEQLFQEKFADPLRSIIDAYQPYDTPTTLQPATNCTMKTNAPSTCLLSTSNSALAGILVSPFDLVGKSCSSPSNILYRLQDVVSSIDLSFHAPVGCGKYNIVLPDFLALFTLSLGLSISICLGVIFSIIIYYFMLKNKHNNNTSLRKLFIGSILLLSTGLLPYLLFSISGTQNTAVRFTTCIAFVLYGFKILEATFGFVPKGATSSLGMYCVYFSMPTEILFDEKTDKPILATRGDMVDSTKNVLLSAVRIITLCSVLSPFSYKPFGETNAGAFHDEIILGDYLDLRHLGNCFAIALFFQQALALGDAVTGNAIQLVTGYRVLRSMRNPMLEATSPSDFWGRRWNILIHLVMKRGVYKPVRKYTSALVASLAVFVMSGLFHEWLVHVVILYNRPLADEIAASGDVLLGSNTAFFVWNFVVIVSERLLAGRESIKSIGMMMPRLLVTFCIIMTSLPFAHWFGNPYLKGQFFDDYERCIPLIRKVGAY